MSFLLDPPLLMAAGVAIESLVDDAEVADRVATATLAGFLGVSVPLWMDVRAAPLRPIWRPFGTRGPREFMVTSGVLPLRVPERVGPRHHLLAAAAFATYPVALHLGRRLGRAVGHRLPV